MFGSYSVYMILGNIALSIVYVAYICIYKQKQKITASFFKEILLLWVQLFGFGISYILVYLLLGTLPLRCAYDLALSITESPEIAMYCSSLLFLLINLFFVNSNFLILKIVGKLKDESSFLGGVKMACESIINIPKKTLIYIFYVLLLILGQAKSIGLINITDEAISQFITINQYTIAIVIGFDRIKSSWIKEVQGFNEYFD